MNQRAARKLLIGLAGLLLAFVAGPFARADGPSTADVSRVFESWDEWESAYGDLVSALDAFDDLGKEPIGNAARLAAVIDGIEMVLGR